MKVAAQVCGFPQGQGQALASRKRRSVPARDDHAARCGAVRTPVKPRATPAPPAPSTLGHSGRIYRLCTPLLRSSCNHQAGSLLPAPQHSPRSSGATRPSASPVIKRPAKRSTFIPAETCIRFQRNSTATRQQTRFARKASKSPASAFAITGSPSRRSPWRRRKRPRCRLRTSAWPRRRSPDRRLADHRFAGIRSPSA